jgi:enoyl-CoA hydratase
LSIIKADGKSRIFGEKDRQRILYLYKRETIEMGFENILFKKERGIATITINRPKSLNALSGETLSEMISALDDAKKDESVRVIVFTGTGDRSFSAGADLKDVKDGNALKMRDFLGKFGELSDVLMNLGKPTIAAVNGLAFGGGCELAISSDIVIASEDARFGLPEINIGVLPAVAISLLPRLIGRKKALELIFIGNDIGAEEAERLGLINKVVPADKLYEAVADFANKLMNKSPVALRFAKNSVYRGLDIEYMKALENGFEMTSLLSTSEDAKEGISAFLEKRKPVWK